MLHIHIRWEGPRELEDAIGAWSLESGDYGVYQIYGTHRVAGPDCLLYIGRADDETFGERLRQHSYDWIRYESAPVRVHVGRLIGEAVPSDEVWYEHIRIAERMLIYANSPPYNASGIDYPEHPGVVHLFNWGMYGRILPEVSTARWFDREPSKWQSYTWPRP